MKTVLLALFLCAGTFGHGQIIIDSWNLTNTTATFTLSGSVTTAFTPTSNTSILYIGVPGDGDWINSKTVALGSTSGTIDSAPILGWEAQTWDSGGDNIQFSTSGIDFTNGGTASVSASISGDFTPANLNPENLIISWGFNSGSAPFPDSNTQVGYYSVTAVPEPSTYAFISMGVLVVGLIVRRRPKTKDQGVSD